MRSGSAALLAVSGSKRLAPISDVPSLSEIIPGFGLESQLGILGPAGMPPDIVARLSAAIKAALESPDVREKLSAEGTRPIRWTTPQEYGDVIRDNQKKFERAVRLANIRPE